MSLMIIKCLNIKQQKNRAGEGSVSERKEIFPNTNKFHPKRELAMKWLHNIGPGHMVKKIPFQLENGIPAPCHR